MSRIAFGISAATTVAFLLWYTLFEFFKPGGSPGMVYPVVLIVMSLVLTAYALSKASAGGVTGDGKGAAVTAFVLSLVCVGFFTLFKTDWFFISIGWAVSQLPMLIGQAISKTAEDKPKTAA